ncbi:MDR family oxidoreductase [Magnetofaba australis]|uniref:Putative alcohol dehydrogenase n=1 Tax=Magnetofaba australis IT-1 TaxID=1434232 RepID=A0A1Y2K261_9PROT|nr:MDR family oxidoreductase [Magnetofaba australis]OSM02108.1 putative alcohol dehydrogenase [Magnetofaba australis IT-1]
MADAFRALVLRQQEKKTLSAFEQLTIDDLPAGEVLVRVSHSSLNYKDGLAITGTGKIVRNFPHVPGIDLAGVVEHSDSPDFQPGDAVLVTGQGMGERFWGGHAQYARLPAPILTPLPDGLSAARAMAIGTAGFTAMLCVLAIEKHGVTPADGPVLVTGAAGGVGSVATLLLSKMGYAVSAVTGRVAEQGDFLRRLGASEILPREELARECKPLESERWAAAVDAVGGQTLATILAQSRYEGIVTAVGLAGGMDLPTTVFPFILRGVTLRGVDSVMCPAPLRNQAWARLAQDLDMTQLDALTHTIGFDQLPAQAQAIIAGQTRGRVVVEIN